MYEHDCCLIHSQAVISMCAEMGLTQRWKLQANTLAKYIQLLFDLRT